MEASKWNLNEYSCVVEEKYTNIAEFIGLDLNKGLVYSEDSKALHQFADRGTNLRETWEVNYYAFLYLVERYLTQKPKPKRERQKKDFDGKKDKKKKKKKKNDGKANEVGNESDEAEEGEEEQEKEDEQEEEQPNKKIPSRGDLFLEAVPSQGYRNGGVKRITDYRYWFVVYKQADEPAAENGDEEKKKQRFKKKDENSIRFTWEKIVNECILYNQRLVSGKKRRYEPEVKHFEKWKAIKNAGHLASLLDSRTGCNFATAHQAQAEGLDVYEKTSPVCATSFFSGAWVPSATDVDADYRAMGKIDKYFTKEEGSDTYTLRFPLRKFVMKIPHSEISVVDLYNRMMPDYQETVYNQIVKMIPVIVKDESVMIDPSQVNVQDFYGQELGEDIRIAQQRKQDPSVNTLFDEKPAKKKKGRKTRLEKMREVAEKWELPIPIPEDASKLKTFDRAVAFQNTHALVSQLLKVPSAVYNYTTVYAPVALRALRNLGKIRQDYNARDRAKHWKDLKHPMSVARKLYLFNQQNVFREYESSCRNLEANLSPTAKKILQYAKKENLYADKRLPHDKYDKRMTPFCSLEAKRYMEWETAYLVNHNHKYMNLAAKYANDSVNMNFNRVHQHMLTHGPQGGEGKSYIWVVVANDIRIPDTTEFLTYETLRARATDETNMNDNVVIFDEVERSLVDKNSNNNDKERAIKMLLSSNKVSVKLLEIDDRGNRRTKVTVSESITVFFGSSNSNVHQLMSPAMKRRWHIADILEMVGVNRAIVDLQLAGLILSEEEKTYKAKLNREHHTLQVKKIPAVFFGLKYLFYL